MQLLVDDIRDFHVDITIRTAKAAIEFFTAVGGNICFEKFYLDFDLGDGTGLEVLKHALFKNADLPDISLVTMNPVGLKQMANCLIDAGYKKKDNRNFYI